MVKKQKDKQYQSAREHRVTQQERSGNGAGIGSVGVVQRRLPFTHCALTLVPFDTPVCNKQGILFENTAVVAFLLHHNIDPVTGETADTSDLIRLNMDKNDEGVWQCPILTKPFTDNSKVVAILQPGGKDANVYSNEAFQELNVKTRNFEDLQSGAKFHKTNDVLILFDPNDNELNRKRDISTFYHVRNSRELEKTKEPESRVRHNVATARVMEKLEQKEKQRRDENAKATQRDEQKRKEIDASNDESSDKESCITAYFKDGKRLIVLAEDVTGVKYTENQGAATSLTSTAVQVTDRNQGREATVDEIIDGLCNSMKSLRKKGYVRMRTNRGTVTLELHCDIVPRTCLNFLALCRTNKYDNSAMHRMIPKFMVQGGKPSNSDEKEECFWGGSMADEFDDRLKHVGANVVSMANAGENTNKRQFFITFATCSHLDRKHSVFASVVDGQDVVADWEKLGADKKERPRQEITIIGTDVLVDPSIEARALEQKRLEKLIAQRTRNSAVAGSINVHDQAVTSSEVGRYLKLKDPGFGTSNDLNDISISRPSKQPKKATKSSYGDFSGW